MSHAIDEVLDRIAAEPRVWVRLAAVRRGDSWIRLVLDLTTGEAPPTFHRLRWEYLSTLLVAETRPGSQVATRLRSGRWQSGRLRVELGDLTTGDVSWDRRASHEVDYGGEPLNWPSVCMTPLQSGSTLSVSSEPLVGPGLPTFLSLHVAVAHLLNVAEPRGGGFNSPMSRLRMQNTRSRITRVRLHSDQVEVFVEGQGLRGLTCELAGQAPGPSMVLARGKSRRVRFSLDEALAPESWVVLHDGGAWLDRRFLNVLWVRRENDVETILEPRSRLESLVGGHEGPDVEFKRELPQDGDSEKRTLMKTVGAFANGGGGTIAFGITDEELVVGLPRVMVRKSIDRLVDIIESWVEPHPDVAFDILDLDRTDDVVLLMTVASGSETPYCVGRPTEGRRVFVRRHGHTRPANQRELRMIVDRTIPRESGGMRLP